jgi:hypothetical protein
MKKLLLLILLLPMAVFSQPKMLFYEAVSASSGFYNPISGMYHWKTDKPASIAVVYDMDNYVINIHSKKPISLELVGFTIIDDNTFSLEAYDANGSYVVLNESFPDIGDHILILNYLDYALKFILEPM